jgi:hypothetical protein
VTTVQLIRSYSKSPAGLAFRLRLAASNPNAALARRLLSVR